MSEREKAPRRTEDEPDVEAHRQNARLNEDERGRGLTPEDRAGESRDDDQPDVEAHRMNQRA